MNEYIGQWWMESVHEAELLEFIRHEFAYKHSKSFRASIPDVQAPLEQSISHRWH